MTKKKSKSNYGKKTKNSKSTLKMKILVVLGILVLGFILIYLMKYYFIDKSYIKINMSTDKKIEYIKVDGKEELMSTQKYVSDLNYSMRYDIDNFKVFKYKNQDIYKNINDIRILLAVEKSSLTKPCSVSKTETGYNSCYVKLDNFTEEYYITTNGRTYKVTVKTPGSSELSEGTKQRISYMINSFIFNF